MSDTPADQTPPIVEPTLADLLRNVRPMGDLSRFAIEDLTAEEEDEFFKILEEL